jgi:hypothetical protein
MQDREVLLSFYPYLANPFNYNCTGDPHEKGRVPYSPGTSEREHSRKIFPVVWRMQLLQHTLCTTISTCCIVAAITLWVWWL